MPHEKCHYGQRPWTMLTTLLLLLHTRAGTVVAAADGVGAIWGHRGQQGVARRNWWQGVVPHQFLHFTGPGVSIGASFCSIWGNLVKGDGAIVEVQCGWRGHVRGGVMLVEIWGAVTKDRLLFNGSCHQIWCADRRGGHHCEAVSPGLHLQLLHDGQNCDVSNAAVIISACASVGASTKCYILNSVTIWAFWCSAGAMFTICTFC